MDVKNLNMGERRFFMVCSALIIAGVLALLFMFMIGGSGPQVLAPAAPHTQIQTTSQDLNGQWNAESNGVKLVATVTNDTISVKMVNGDTTINWWDGSFVSTAVDGDAVASIKKQDADIMVMSSSDNQTFLVGDGTLTFDMTFLGVTKTVKMTHV